MTLEERASSDKFSRKHNKKCESGIHYLVYPSHLGFAIHIKCNTCRKQKDITDYGCW